jgi:Tol biopolymer transport system component
VNLGPTVNSTARDLVPTFSRDGHWMFFASERSGGFGGADIWASWRAHTHDDFGWETPINLGPGVNTAFNDNGVGYFENDDGGAPQLFFGSNRPGGLGGADLYVSELQPDGSWGSATWLPELSSGPNDDNRPNVRHDGLELFFYSIRAGGVGGVDLWVSTRESLDQPWSTPVNVGAPVNSSATELHPYLSSDRETLFFGSARAGGLGGVDLYMSTRSKTHGSKSE